MKSGPRTKSGPIPNGMPLTGQVLLRVNSFDLARSNDIVAKTISGILPMREDSNVGMTVVFSFIHSCKSKPGFVYIYNICFSLSCVF